MRKTLDHERRAARLLRWYPPAWRDRYGEEFIDHLEQEFTDRPVDRRRSINVARKGLVARIGDIGLSTTAATSCDVRAALGTSIALIALMTVVMIDLWSRAMLAWSRREYHPIPVSATTGVLTVALTLLTVVLGTVFLAVAVFVGRQFLRGRARPILGPSLLAAASIGFLIYAARIFPRLLAPYVDGIHGLQRMSLLHPGETIANFAQVMWELTQGWVAPWGQGTPEVSAGHLVVNDCVPLAMFVLGVALALLIRRVEFPRTFTRLFVPTIAILGTLTITFFVSYIAWSELGGPSNFEYFFPESPWLGVVYLVFLGLVPLLVVRLWILAMRTQPRRRLNRIEITS